MANNPKQQLRWWHLVIVLAIPLVALFHPSARPELVLFSNDGPLGIISSEAGALPGAFTGYWDDLNWVGRENPSALPDFSMLLGLVVNSSVTYSKVYAPMSLLFLGVAGWCFFRSLGFRSIVCLLGAVAFALNMNAFSNACWGLPSRATTLASILLALGALHLQPPRWPALKYVLCGFAVGHGVMEGFDVGALYSLVVAAYVGFLSLTREGDAGQNGLKAVGWIGVVAIAAVVFSAQALGTLIGTQVQGVAGMEQTAEAKEERWKAATQWSLPIKEGLRVAVPGLFGYRMTDSGGKVEASSYWGAVGRADGWEIHKQGLPRHSGSGEYAGVLVLFLAAFAVFQSLRGSSSPFETRARYTVWFWMAIAALSMLLAFGKHGPLYRIAYEIPYVSLIRNPIKFMHLFHLAVIVLFAYGVQVLWVHYLCRAKDHQKTLSAYLKQWWARSAGFERRWTFGSLVFVIISALLWLVYASSGSEMARVLVAGAIPSAVAPEIHAFSVNELLWSLGFLIGGFAVVTLIVSGAAKTSQRKVLGFLLLLLLTLDLARANGFWVVYYDYKQKYASNPVIDTLRTEAHERRVTSTLNPFAPSSLSNENGAFFGVIANSWLQHQFPYFNIHSLDVVQMPRPQMMDLTFGSLFVPQSVQEGYKYTRLWELTSTRYLLGMTGYVAVLNQQFDHRRDRFEVLKRFNFVPRSGSKGNAVKVDDLTAQEDPAGSFGIIEFSGALPKVKRYDRWEVLLDDQSALRRLSDLQFDPAEGVIVSTEGVASAPGETAQGSGTAEIESYHPKTIRIKTTGPAPGIVLLNDRFHPHWNVYVDGAPRPMLRCNYIMRGVEVPAGDQVVEFRFEPPQTGLVISLVSLSLGGLICIYIGMGRERRMLPPPAVSAGVRSGASGFTSTRAAEPDPS